LLSKKALVTFEHKLMRVGIVAPTTLEAQQRLLQVDFPWLDAIPFGLDSLSLHTDLQVAGLGGLVLFIEPADALPQLLGHLEAMGLGDRPSVLVSSSAGDAAWCHAFRFGIVDIIPVGQLSEDTLRAAFLESERRPGMMQGAGAFRELPQLLAHLTRFGRTGVVELRLPVSLARLSYCWGRMTEVSGVTLDIAGLPEAPEETAWVFREEPPPASKVTLAHGFEPLISDERPMLKSHVEVTAADVVPAQTRVLVVDDDLALVRLLTMFLTKRGFVAVGANGGEEALVALASQTFDVAVLDLDMPGIDGWNVLGALQEDPRTWDTRVLICSAHDQYRDVIARAGPRAHAAVPKTTKLKEIERCIRELVVPRVAFERTLAARGFDDATCFQGIDEIGAAWSLLALERAGATGMVTGEAGSARVSMWFVEGRLMQAEAVARSGRCSGLDALRLMLTGRPRTLTLDSGTVPQGEAFAGATTTTIVATALRRLAVEQHQLSELAVGQVVAFSVNQALYRLYASVGPLPRRQIASALCEQSLPPSSVSAQLGVPAQTVSFVMRDLVRRGVIELSTA
jgi:CheY-like chemotaxis protein